MVNRKAIRVAIIGSGNVAEALARALRRAPVEVVQVWARNAERGRKVARLAETRWCGEADGLAVADIYLIAVRDAAIAEVAAALPFPKGSIVAHTAGCVALDMLPASVRRGVFYPFQTFTAGRRVNFRQVPVFIETEQDDRTFHKLHDLANMISDRVSWADGAARARIHLSGVFASNFVNAMLGCAAEALLGTGVTLGELEPLITETARKAVESGNPASVQTGPAVRGDEATQQRHLQLLWRNPELQEIYKRISEYIWKTSKR